MKEKLNTVFPVDKKPEMFFSDPIYVEKDCFVLWENEWLSLTNDLFKTMYRKKKKTQFNRINCYKAQITTLKNAKDEK